MGASARAYNTLFGWTETVADLIDSKAVVEQHCRCPSRVLSLYLVRDQLGPAFSFWNRHPVCPRCEERAWFGAKRAGAALWPVQMRQGAPEEVERLRAGWSAPDLQRPSCPGPKTR